MNLRIGIAALSVMLSGCESYSSILSVSPEWVVQFQSERKVLKDCTLEDLRQKNPEWSYEESEQPREKASRITAWFRTLIGTQGVNIGWDVRFVTVDNGKTQVEGRTGMKTIWGSSILPRAALEEIVSSCARDFPAS